LSRQGQQKPPQFYGDNLIYPGFFCKTALEILDMNSKIKVQSAKLRKALPQGGSSTFLIFAF